MNFASDNASRTAPEILAALQTANTGPAMPYGADGWTERLTARFCALFEAEVAVFPVATGTAANALALSALVPPFGAILAHPHAHIVEDECGAPEFFTGGAKFLTVDGADGKMPPAGLEATIGDAGIGFVHHVQPASIGISQTTEAGTVYALDEIRAISVIARKHGLRLHMDGARFANAVAALGCSPADATWRAGVDVLSFGATKNGALGAEAVIFFDRGFARDFPYRRKRGGHLLSKQRFVSAQLLAYLNDDLWLRNARHANAMARRLADGLAKAPSARLVHPVQSNMVFVELPENAIVRLLDRGFRFYRWRTDTSTTLRLVTAFDTEASDVDAFIAVASLA
ncbi:MAG: low specificity L-threonine aldolase [Rhodospirillaceae bacterium]|nr:low specificity L-threonine aldolase [Rhodospirillaceae bacterium]